MSCEGRGLKVGVAVTAGEGADGLSGDRSVLVTVHLGNSSYGW